MNRRPTSYNQWAEATYVNLEDDPTLYPRQAHPVQNGLPTSFEKNITIPRPKYWERKETQVRSFLVGE